jgi:hypothetical protein
LAENFDLIISDLDGIKVEYEDQEYNSSQIIEDAPDLDIDEPIVIEDDPDFAEVDSEDMDVGKLFVTKNLKDLDRELFKESFEKIGECFFWNAEDFGETKNSDWVDKNCLVIGSEQGALCVIDLNVSWVFE